MEGREALLVQIVLGKEDAHQTGFPCLSATPGEAADLGYTPCPRSAEPTDHLSFPSGLLASWRLPAAAAERQAELSPREIRSPGQPI